MYFYNILFYLKLIKIDIYERNKKRDFFLKRIIKLKKNVMIFVQNNFILDIQMQENKNAMKIKQLLYIYLFIAFLKYFLLCEKHSSI